jgi:Uma2 family endonuclease
MAAPASSVAQAAATETADELLAVARRRFTVDEYYRMAEAGILSPEERVELIDGEIVPLSPIGDRHQACVDRLTQLFVRRAGDAAIARVHGPVRLDDRTEPEPDLALLRLRPDF